MELRDYALSILTARSQEGKLLPPIDITDLHPGPPLRLTQPLRPPELEFSTRRTKMPRPAALSEPHRRAISLHRFANHELMALEIMAWVLLSFPDAPPAFRRGVMHILAEEQIHLGLYIQRLQSHGMNFGDLPVNDYFWDKLPTWDTVLHYLSGMCLTFEAANLDFALEYIKHFRAVGDEETAQVLERVHTDELRHVRFGVNWLRRLKDPSLSDWKAYTDHLAFPLHPARSRGAVYHRDQRLLVGLDDNFLRELDQLPTAGETMHPRGPVLLRLAGNP